MRKLSLVAAISFLALAACNRGIPAPDESASASAPATATADPLASRDGQVGSAPADTTARPLMQAQVVLDRLGFTPGVIDGKMGLSMHNALAAFQEATGIAVTGELDTATQEALKQYQSIPATRMVTIPADFAAGPFVDVPKDPADQAKLPELGYATLDEKLAERFHTTIETLRALNPGDAPTASVAPVASSLASETGTAAMFSAGQAIRVPNIGHDEIVSGMVKDADWLKTLVSLGVGTDQPTVEKIVVSKSKGTLKAYDSADKLVAVYTATMGSQHDPLPLGTWKVNGISYNPKFHYNPALFWDASPGDKKATLPPGPNGPVGVVWIDLSKPHYGIHGTPKPETIGRAESHGCVRLTNWDAARLAQMVHAGTKVVFEA